MVKTISTTQLNDLSTLAKSSERQRAHLNVHETLDASVQRLFIATEPNTYIRPHRHVQAHKWEFFTVLNGEMDFLLFDEEGNIVKRIALGDQNIRSIEVQPNQWHSYVCKKSGTVALEIKEGAYIPSAPEDFAPWSPAENTKKAVVYLKWMRTAAM